MYVYGYFHMASPLTKVSRVSVDLMVTFVTVVVVGTGFTVVHMITMVTFSTVVTFFVKLPLSPGYCAHANVPEMLPCAYSSYRVHFHIWNQAEICSGCCSA